jgi:hypothetical protein
MGTHFVYIVGDALRLFCLEKVVGGLEVGLDFLWGGE